MNCSGNKGIDELGPCVEKNSVLNGDLLQHSVQSMGVYVM